MSKAQPGTFKALIEAKEQREREERSKLELVPKEIEQQQTTHPIAVPHTISPSGLSADDSTEKKHPVAPERDFSKVPNSIKRAVEQSKFPNSSLAIYLYLYSLTRGAVQPIRSIRVNKAKLLAGANLRAEKSLLKNLAHLKSLGFVKITVFNGDHSGNEYEVFMPEEIELNPPTYLPTEQPTYLPTKSTPLPTVQRLVGRWVETVENKDTYENPKTSFKDNTKNDDEAFAEFIEIFQRAAEELTGGRVTGSEAGKMGELAEVLVGELRRAGRHTSEITSVPAFLTEVLRRKQKRGAAETMAAGNKFIGRTVDSVGKAVVEAKAAGGEIKRLDEQGRQRALEQLREFAGEEFLEDFKKWYIPDDWTWLTSQLNCIQKL